MATQAHCAYCFESLAASFERRDPLSLAQVEELWEQYHLANSKENGQATIEDKDENEDNGGDDGEDEEAEVIDDEMTDAETDEPVHPKPAAISRLLNSQSQSESASSSSSSLPSTRSSQTSSKAQSEASAGTTSTGAGTGTPASSLSSRSSLFSFGRKKQQQQERQHQEGAEGSSKRGVAASSEERHPLFVTWNVVSQRSGHKSLRGCIGTFEAQELEYGLRSYALTSAFEDMRFNPIPASQLPHLSCDVTLLTDFSQPCDDALDWELGKHGIRISFTRHGRRYGATYLPSVAQEQGWTKEETIESLMRKAGWNGGSGWAKTWKDGRGELVRYEGKKIELGFEEWKAWRDWVGERVMN